MMLSKLDYQLDRIHYPLLDYHTSLLALIKTELSLRGREINENHQFHYGIFFPNQFHFGKKIKKIVRAIVAIYFFIGSNLEFFYKNILQKYFTNF